MTLDASVMARVKHSSDNSSLPPYDTSVEEIENQKLPEGFGLYYEQLVKTSQLLLRDVSGIFDACANFVCKFDLIQLLSSVSFECYVNEYELSSSTFQEGMMEASTIELKYLGKGTPLPISIEEDLEDHTYYSAQPRSPIFMIDLEYMGKGKPAIPVELEQTITEDE